MTIDELAEKFYNENIQVSMYGGYDGCDEEVDELKVTPEVFKDNLKRMLNELLENNKKCSD